MPIFSEYHIQDTLHKSVKTVILFPVASEWYRGHGSAVSLQLMGVGTRHCRVLTVSNINSDATGVDIIYQGEKFNQNNSIIFQPIEAKYQTVKTLPRLKHEYLIRPNFNHESLGSLTAGFAREIRHSLKCLNYEQSSVEVSEKLLE